MSFVDMYWALLHFTRRSVRDERGASLVEYALLLALIVVVCVGAITIIGDSTNNTLSKTASILQ